MVCILLHFIRAQRDGIWELHTCSFKKTLPLYHYDHTNYARLSMIYLAEMNQLPRAVKKESVKRNFVVKVSNSQFNQADLDHSQEWLNGIGKKVVE